MPRKLIECEVHTESVLQTHIRNFLQAQIRVGLGVGLGLS